jgi:penicillin-binding protein 1C
LEILYPQEGSRLWIPREFGGEWQKVLMRVAHQQSASTVFWYLDDSYLGKTINRHAIPSDLKEGWHVLEGVDE